jgi:hypothetical protein
MPVARWRRNSRSRALCTVFGHPHERDVRHQLETYGGPGRWTVEVRGGAVTIRDAMDDKTDRHVATVLAEAVRGVTVVHMATARPQ